MENLKREFQKKLLNWYESNKREFLWRKKTDPYQIIIAEIMLQRTNAEKAEKSYPIFLKKFPNIEELDKAEDAEIVKSIEYLGLQNDKLKTFRDLTDKATGHFGGSIPKDKEDLLSIYGIGEYIAKATLCFAFNKREPVVDMSIVRILKRAFNIESEKNTPTTDSNIWDQAKKLLPKKNYKKFNYALLDFGSVVCKIRSPKCEICFFSSSCHYKLNKN